MKKTIILKFIVILFISFSAQLAYGDVLTSYSDEMGGNSFTSRTAVDQQVTEWKNLAIASGACPSIATNFITYDLTTATVGGSSITFTLDSVGMTVSNRDMNGPVNGSLGGAVSLSNTATLQDGAPRPQSFFTGTPAFYSELTGSNSNKNGILIEFSTPIRVFGAWLGDLETRTTAGGTAAFVRYFDSTNTQIGSDTIIPPSDIWLTANGIDQTGCSNTVAACGNRTTRWLGFVADAATPVSSMLVVVGDEDIVGDGFQEHISLIAPTIAQDFSCGDIDLNVRKFAPEGEINAGQNIVYNIVVQNRGPADATNVIATDTLPANLTAITATPSQGLCTITYPNISCSLGTINANDGFVTIKISASPLASGAFLNTISVAADQNDADPTNNLDTATANVEPTQTPTSTPTPIPTDPVFCSKTSLKTSHLILDGSAADMLKLSKQVASIAESNTRTVESCNSRNINSLLAEIDTQYNMIWNKTWINLPEQAYECSRVTPVSCQSVDVTTVLSEIKKASLLLRSRAKRLTNMQCFKTSKKVKLIAARIDDSYQRLISELDSHPSSFLSCAE